MGQRIEGRIIKKIEKEGINFVYLIKYEECGKEKIIKSVDYSTRYNKNKYKENDKVWFELNEKIRARVIDDDLIEMDYDSTNGIVFPILMIALLVVFWLISQFTENENYLWIGFGLLFLLFVLFGVILVLKTTKSVTNGNSVKGKIVSKKEKTVFRNSDISSDRTEYHVFTFEVLYNDKIYEIMDNKTEFSEKLKVDDVVDIVVYNDIAYFSKVIEESQRLGRIRTSDIGIMDKISAVGIIGGFFGSIIYLFIVNEKLFSKPILIIPLVVLIIITLVSANLQHKENIKKNRYDK